VAGTLIGASQLLYYAVARVLGVPNPGGVEGNLLQAAAEPASAAIVYGAAWGYQRYALRQQAAAFEEVPRQAGIRHLYTHLVSLIALAVFASGVAGLLWTLGDLVVTPASSAETWRGNIALYSTLVIVGLPVWLLHWRPGEVAEAPSLARRLYLYLSLIGAMLTLIGGAAAALYRLIGLVLGSGSTTEVLTDLVHAMAVAIVAAAIAVYHWRVLRADSVRGQPSVTSEQPEVVPAERSEVVVRLRAADPATLEHALAELRAAGVELTVIT
jgi:hypothetical protein